MDHCATVNSAEREGADSRPRFPPITSASPARSTTPPAGSPPAAALAARAACRAPQALDRPALRTDAPAGARRASGSHPRAWRTPTSALRGQRAGLLPGDREARHQGAGSEARSVGDPPREHPGAEARPGEREIGGELHPGAPRSRERPRGTAVELDGLQVAVALAVVRGDPGRAGSVELPGSTRRCYRRQTGRRAGRGALPPPAQPWPQSGTPPSKGSATPASV